jgi:hypothetical protein
MQNNKKNQSQLIKNTEELKIKSRRRLIGSIIILLITLVILLKITNQANQPNQNVKITIIKESIDTQIIKSKESNIAITKLESVTIAPSNLVESNTPQNQELKVKLVESNSSYEKPNQLINEEKPNNLVINKSHIVPKIIFEIVKDINPEDILNNIKSEKKIYYVQFIALANKDKIIVEKNNLHKLGIHSNLSQTIINNKVFYRLRSQAFDSKEKAMEYLNIVKTKINS